jgi:plastocyanin
MRGHGLLVGGYVLCIALATPAALFASEEPVPAPATTTQPVPQAELPTTAEAPSHEVPSYSEVEDGESDAEAHSSAEFAVAMRDIEFRPGTIRIGRGDTVEWKNEDEVRHDAIGRDSSFDTPVIGPGETSSHTFDAAGTYPYFCSLHQGMNGTVKVSSSSSGGGSNGSGGVSGGTTLGSGSSSFGSGSSSSLASTGQDLLWMALVGGALVWVGAALAVIVAQLRDQRRGAR